VTFALVRVGDTALRTAAPRLDAFRDLVQTTPELEGRLSLFAYAPGGDGLVRARMFAPLAGTWEDPATGSASATLAAFLLQLGADARTELTIRQGVEMGRPSTLHASAWRAAEGIRAAVRGACVPVFSGEVRL
jgi:trans-2,3-dihydro-3-hydroxyanthranilate isomerase